MHKETDKKTLTQENRELKEKLEAQSAEIERAQAAKSRLQRANDHLQDHLAAIEQGLIYQLAVEIKKGISPIGKNTLTMPIRILRRIYHWVQGKRTGRGGAGLMYEEGFTPRQHRQQERRFHRDLEAFFALAEAHQDKPVVLLSTGTKRIGDMNRLNRTMAFASRLAEANIPTIYVFYRFRPGPVPDDYTGGFLLQLPNDFLHQNASQMAVQFSNPDRLFIASIPDVHAVNEISLFRGFGWKTLYEVRDDWEAFHLAGVGRWYSRWYERHLCQNADAVSAVSIFLKNKMETLGSNPRRTHVIPNGLRRDFYEQARESFEARKRGYPGKNVLGYFGHLTEKWFNWPLLIKTAKKMPQTRFEIIGFGAPETLSLPANVTLMGEMSHAEILEIASRWRAALIPFKQSQLARAVDPIKLYEYLALGLPVVACRMDNLLSSPRTFIYQRDKDFMKTIGAAVEQPPTEVNWQALDTFLKNSFWQMRVEDTLSLVLDTAHLRLGH